MVNKLDFLQKKRDPNLCLNESHWISPFFKNKRCSIGQRLAITFNELLIK